MEYKHKFEPETGKKIIAYSGINVALKMSDLKDIVNTIIVTNVS